MELQSRVSTTEITDEDLDTVEQQRKQKVKVSRILEEGDNIHMHSYKEALEKMDEVKEDIQEGLEQYS